MVEKYKEALREAFQDFDFLDYKYSIDIHQRVFDTNEFGRLILKTGDYNWMINIRSSYSDLEDLYSHNIIQPNQKDITLYKIGFNFRSKKDYSKSNISNYRAGITEDINEFKERFDECIAKVNSLLEKHNNIIFTNPFIDFDPKKYIDIYKKHRVEFFKYYTIFLLGNKTVFRNEILKI